MDESKQAWDEVAEGFAKFGRMVSERYKTMSKEHASEPHEGGGSDAIRRATEELDCAFTSLGDTLRDDDAKEQLRTTGKKLSEALKATFSEVGEQLRSRRTQS
ncbi:MAG: hypothetical protein ACXVEY_13415 [Actinomycetota bacterium]